MGCTPAATAAAAATPSLRPPLWALDVPAAGRHKRDREAGL